MSEPRGRGHGHPSPVTGRLITWQVRPVFEFWIGGSSVPGKWIIIVAAGPPQLTTASEPVKTREDRHTSCQSRAKAVFAGSRGAVRIVHFQRRPFSGQYSIESVF